MRLALAVLMVAAASFPTLAAEDLLLGHPRTKVEAALPNLPKDQLDLLVYRIPTLPQVLQNAQPVSADAVDPYENLGLTRVELAAKFPSGEIDRLAAYLRLIETRQAQN